MIYISINFLHMKRNDHELQTIVRLFVIYHFIILFYLHGFYPFKRIPREIYFNEYLTDLRFSAVYQNPNMFKVH